MDPSQRLRVSLFLPRNFGQFLIVGLVGGAIACSQANSLYAQSASALSSPRDPSEQMIQGSDPDKEETRQFAADFVQRHWGLRFEPQGKRLVVEHVVPGGRAQAAGLRAGDELNFVDYQNFTRRELLESYLQGNFGRAIPFEVRRGEQQIVVEITIPEPTPSDAWVGIAFEDPETVERGAVKLGAVVQELTPDGPAASAGIQKGDRITECGAQPIASPTEFARVIGLHSPGVELAVKIDRKGMEQTVPLILGASRSQLAQGAVSSSPFSTKPASTSPRVPDPNTLGESRVPLSGQQQDLEKVLQKLRQEVARLRLELQSRPGFPHLAH